MSNPPTASRAVDGRRLSPEYLHELRTPLNHILGFSEMLTEQAQEEGQAGFVQDLESIHTAARQLLALLDQDSQASVESPPAVVQRKNNEDYETGDAPVLSERNAASQVDATHGESTGDTRQPLPALILVVDDNRANRDLLSRRLEAQGHHVATAENGREGLAAVRRQPFDLVLLDIMMPEIDGYTVLAQIKADESLRHLPVIMISALDEIDSVVRCIELGAEDYLTKPFNPVFLRARVDACLEKKRAHDREMHLFRQLQENFGRLQSLEKQRDDLTNMIVHDLRTPLSSVILGMQTLKVVGELDETQQEMADIAISGGETLLGMINDLLDVEKLESGSMQIECDVLSVEGLTLSAVSQVASLGRSKGVSVTRSTGTNPLPLYGDENKLLRVLVNLLGNAIKFTPNGGTVHLAVRCDNDSESAEFSVSDTGEGIPEDAFDRIFEKFGQVDTRQGGRTMSTGLGLTFCKLTVEAHGGAIRVESSPGKGSTFSFTIPRAQTAAGRHLSA